MVRVPTYNSYMNMVAQTIDIKSQLDLYSYQVTSGLKSPTYSGYGMQAHTIVSLESMLGVTSNFITNNDVIQVELNSYSTPACKGWLPLTRLRACHTLALSLFPPSHTNM